MKLGEYIENLNKLAAEHPEYLDLDVINSSDDEGNDYNFILGHEPTPMFHDKDNNYFLDKDNFDYESEGEEEFEPNVICVN